MADGDLATKDKPAPVLPEHDETVDVWQAERFAAGDKDPVPPSNPRPATREAGQGPSAGADQGVCPQAQQMLKGFAINAGGPTPGDRPGGTLPPSSKPGDDTGDRQTDQKRDKKDEDDEGDRRKEKLAEKDPDRRRTVAEDVATLFDPEAKQKDAEAAGERLVKTGSRTGGWSDKDQKDAVSWLATMAGSSEVSRRDQRIAQGLLKDVFDNLKEQDQTLSQPETRDRIMAMGKQGLDMLKDVAAANPVDKDEKNPAGRDTRDSANFLIGSIEAHAANHKLWEALASRGRNPGGVVAAQKELTDRMSDMSDAKGLGYIEQMRMDWLGDGPEKGWKPDGDYFKAGQKALQDAATKLLQDGKGLSDPAVRERLLAMGPHALPVLDKVVQSNPTSADDKSPAGKQMRETAAGLMKQIGRSEARTKMHDAWFALSSIDNDGANKIKDEMVKRGTDLTNLAGTEALRELNGWVHEWKPTSPHHKLAKDALETAAKSLIGNGSSLEKPEVKERVRAMGVTALPQLDQIAKDGGTGAGEAKILAMAIRSDEAKRPKIVLIKGRSSEL